MGINPFHHSPEKLLKTFIRDVPERNKVIEVLDTYLSSVSPIDTLKKTGEIPFSSERKYGISIYGDIALVLGAPEVLLRESSESTKTLTRYAEEGYRVLCFGYMKSTSEVADLTKHFHLLGTMILEDPIREDVVSSLLSLEKNNIEYRIISGDSMKTVVAVAKKLNKNYPIRPINADEMNFSQKDQLKEQVLSHNIYTRITPEQKKIIIMVLKESGLFTVMIGDGVNDVLAIKEADLGIAMNAGASMTKDVADIVLMNDSFASLPLLLKEGRRVVTNIQTIANLYLVKNISAMLSILFLGFIGFRFPFDPRHVQLSSLLIIGIPSVLLAFEKHSFSFTDNGFIKRLMVFSGVVGFVNAVMYTCVFSYYELVSDTSLYSQTMVLINVLCGGMLTIILIYMQYYSLKQIVKRKIIQLLFVFDIMLAIIIFSLPNIREFFNVQEVTLLDVCVAGVAALLAAFVSAIILKRMRVIK